ncbi:MAG TPA: GAF and ANTAR domain-containing protein [Pseudonocardiaceae bacterium]|nr:GAF and ANTAR domain-containing protein [Pseudonocardiaceae bacterium]
MNATSGHGAGRGRPSSSHTGQAVGLDALAVQMGELARSLQQETSLRDTLQGIVAAAVDTVPGAQYAGISEVQGGREINTPAWTDELVRATDTAQYETGQGPCLSAIAVQHTVRVSDMANDDRWPEFAKRAVQRGVGSMLSLQLYVVGDNLGALNLYNREPDAFDDDSEHVGLLFASHAAVAMAGAQRRDQLNRGMGTRDLIGQAKGILMERHKLTAEQAFLLLVRASQATHTKLRDIAEQLTTVGQLPIGEDAVPGRE